MSLKLTDQLNHGNNNPFDFDSKYFEVKNLIKILNE